MWIWFKNIYLLCIINLVFQFLNYWTKNKKIEFEGILESETPPKKTISVIFFAKVYVFIIEPNMEAHLKYFQKNKLFPFY